MLAKEVTYKDFGGTVRTETVYFNLTASELVEMEMMSNESLGDKLTRIINAQDGKVIMTEFLAIMKKGYGVRSEDGRRFIKSPELWDEFVQTELYNTIFMELCTDSKAGAEFVNGLMPKGLPGQPGADVPTMTPAEAARKASEAAMQGFNRPRAEENYGAPAPVTPPANSVADAAAQARAEYDAKIAEIQRQNAANQ